MTIRTIILVLSFAAILQAQSKTRPIRAIQCNGAGTATAATCAPDPAITALANLSTIPRVVIKFVPVASTNGTALTLAINGLAATPVRKAVGASAAELAANDLRAGVEYSLEYNGTEFLVTSNLGNGGGGGGTGDVSSSIGSSTNLTLVVFDGTTGKVVTQATGCSWISATQSIACAGGFAGGDGALNSKIELPELAANGTNYIVIYGEGNQTANTCVVLRGNGNPTSGQAWFATGTTQTITEPAPIGARTCVVMALSDPPAAGGGASATTGGGFMISTGGSEFRFVSSAALGDTPTNNQVRVRQFILPFSLKLARGTIFASGAASATTGVVFGIYADNGGVPGALVANSQLATTGWDFSGWRNLTWASPPTLSPGVYWLAYAAEAVAGLVFYYPDSGGTGAMSSQFDQQRALPALAKCANPATGTGASLALPSSCGSVTATSAELPGLKVWAQ